MYDFEILHQCGKRDKTKRQKVLGLICTFVYVPEGKTGRSLPPAPKSRACNSSGS